MNRGTRLFGATLVALLAVFGNAPVAHCDPGTCGVFGGTWVKEDGFTFAIVQNSCIMGGSSPTDGAYDHSLTGIAMGPRAIAEVRRTDPTGCVSTLYLSLTLASGGGQFVQDTVGTDGRCGLPPGMTEHFVYTRR